ncbi:nad kinase [Anaeramoeba flamelloides]|uniref:Nad kinase n=1 Tax=Anaeramoeba flamelloides TaxID=1746091 RepID=A0ABQ8ZAS2_9EUKA|nr:nad kinase [Anaeramoeba flamelloides]
MSNTQKSSQNLAISKKKRSTSVYAKYNESKPIVCDLNKYEEDLINHDKEKNKFLKVKNLPKTPITVIESRSHNTKPISIRNLCQSRFIKGPNVRKSLQLKWGSRPKTVLVIKKKDSKSATRITKKILHYLVYGAKVNVLIEPSAQKDFPDNTPFKNDNKSYLNEIVDFVVSVGGDGTILHVCNLFNLQPIPPLLAFHSGTLGFLACYDYKDYRNSIKSTIKGKFFLTLRSRLVCRVFSNNELVYKTNVLNEVVVGRGSSSHLCNLKCLCDEVSFTRIQADGVLIGTPTGSTAYNLSAGGPITHPSSSGILFTPICAHSLSARPLVFPDSVKLKIKVARSSRGTCTCFFDGINGCTLNRGDYIVISTSKYPLPSINRTNAISDWFSGISTILSWNDRKVVQKPLSTKK